MNKNTLHSFSHGLIMFCECPTQVEGPTEYVYGRQDGCKACMDSSYMTLNGLCFMVTWIIFENRLLEIGLTQNRETVTL